MKIGLIDVDNHNFPSLPLMKLATYHKKLRNIVGWCDPSREYDIICKAKIFKFTKDTEYNLRAELVIEVGTGYENSQNLPKEIENIIG